MRNLFKTIWNEFFKSTKLKQTAKEINAEAERNLKIDQWCEAVIKHFKCSECKGKVPIISQELKYCNKCGFQFTKTTQNV